MSDEIERPASPEEEAEAGRLAEALEGSPADAPAEELAAARFLQALGAAERGDEVAARRLRHALVRDAGRERRMRRERLAAAAAILLAASTTVFFLARHRPAPTLADLEAQERKARAAVAALVDPESGTPRLHTLNDTLRDARLDSLLRSRLESVLSGRTSSGAPARPSPTPGGPVS